jgi:hypothetical protein
MTVRVNTISLGQARIWLIVLVLFCHYLTLFCSGDDSIQWHSVIPQGSIGVCSVNTWKKNFPGCQFEDGVSEGRLELVEQDKRLCWRVTCKTGGIGPERGGVGWRSKSPGERPSYVIPFVLKRVSSSSRVASYQGSAEAPKRQQVVVSALGTMVGLFE